MELDSYLQDEGQVGEHISQGNFTVDLSKARAKLSESALPSEYHYLLKFVQLANRLFAPELHIKIGRRSTKLVFSTSRTQSEVLSLDKLLTSLEDPLRERAKEMKDLVTGILGSLSPEVVGISWRVAFDGVEHTLSVDSERVVTSQSREIETTEEARCEFEVEHKGSWKFWQGAAGRAETSSIIIENCAFSPTRIFIDNREVETGDLQVLLSSDSKQGNAKSALWNTFLVLADSEEHGLALRRPSLSNYVVRRDMFSLWAQGTRVNNSLWPNVEVNTSWMLQFEKAGERLNMRFSRKIDKYKLAVGLNSLNPEPDEEARVMVVRQGVLLHSRSLSMGDGFFQDFAGCSLIWADEELETDLTGFQLIDGEALRKRIFAFRDKIKSAEEFLAEGQELITIPRLKSRQSAVQEELEELAKGLNRKR